MKKDDIINHMVSVLKKHKISISGIRVNIDNRPSRRGGYQAKVDIPIDKITALKLLTNKNKLSDLLRDVKAVDDKLILKTQVCNVGKTGSAIRLYLSKKPCKIEKFIQRRSALKSVALHTDNNILVSVQIGMTIQVLNAPESFSNSKIQSISNQFIKLFSDIENKTKNIPIKFFSNKTVLIIK